MYCAIASFVDSMTFESLLAYITINASSSDNVSTMGALRGGGEESSSEWSSF